MTREPRRVLLYAITDRQRLGLDADVLVERVGWLARAGVEFIQVRERDLADAAAVALLRRAVDVVSGTGTRVFANDRVDVAIAAGAYGVQLRGDAYPAARARALVPREFLIGRSVHSLAEAVQADRDGGCDFLLFGTIFPSRGKPPAHPTTGIAALADACRAVARPVIAIGGIDSGSAAAVANAGAAGIAGVDVFFAVTSEAEARQRVAALRRAIDTRSSVV